MYPAIPLFFSFETCRKYPAISLHRNQVEFIAADTSTPTHPIVASLTAGCAEIFAKLQHLCFFHSFSFSTPASDQGTKKSWIF
jgi:hypothetical protein